MQHLAPDIAERLVVRQEDIPQHVEEEIKHYRQHMLRPLEVHYCVLCMCLVITNVYTAVYIPGQELHVYDCIPTQDYIIKHNQQFVIELDANLPPKDLFRVCTCTCTACLYLHVIMFTCTVQVHVYIHLIQFAYLLEVPVHLHVHTHHVSTCTLSV